MVGLVGFEPTWAKPTDFTDQPSRQLLDRPQQKKLSYLPVSVIVSTVSYRELNSLRFFDLINRF